MSKKKPGTVMTARQFAAKMEIDYRTALRWLNAELVPGAQMKDSPVGVFWEIPTTALKMKRPKPGPKPTKKAARPKTF
jgi:hypothetical protein